MTAVSKASVRTLGELLDDPSWSYAAFPRWSNPNGHEDAEDVANETLDRLPAGHPAIAPAKELCVRILRAPNDPALVSAGVVPIHFQDVPTLAARGARSKTPFAWAFIVEGVLVVLTLHSAFEDNVFGDGAIDEGLNAYTELCLLVYRARPAGADAVYAFDTRLGRKGFHRDKVKRAARIHRWRVFVAGAEVDLNNVLMGSVNNGVTESQSETFLTATGKGELDKIRNELYPKGPQGLPFYHRLRTRRIVDPADPELTHDEVLKGQVEPRDDPATIAAVQDLCTRIANGEPWTTLGPYAGSEHKVRSRHALHMQLPEAMRPTLDDPRVKDPGHALKRHFTLDHLNLLRTGNWARRYHGKVQAAVEYGTHGTAKTYTADQLNAMTDKQKAKALKGYFEVSVFWGVPMLAGSDGELRPWGLSHDVLTKMEERLRKEADTSQPTGAAAHARDKKPLAGVPCWHNDTHCLVITSRRPEAYELWRRPVGACVSASGRRNGWTGKHRGERVIGARADRMHQSFGSALVDLLEQLGDQVATLTVPVPRQQQEDASERRRRQLQLDITTARAQVKDFGQRAEGARALAQMEAASDPVEGRRLLAEAKQLEQDAQQKQLEVAALQQQLEQVTATADDEPTATMDFSQPTAVAAGLLAYPDQAPPQLNAAMLLLVRDTLRFTPAPDQLSVQWSATVHLPLADGSVGTHPIHGVVGSRWRDNTRGSTTNWAVYMNVARRYFAAPPKADGTAVNFEDVAAELGWTPAEVERKLFAFLGSIRGLPKGVVSPHALPSRWMRAALIDCPVAEVRHAMWAHLVPEEAQVAAYLTPLYRALVQSTYMDPDARWTSYWAGDTHVYRRRLMELCRNATHVAAGVRIHQAARTLGVSQKDVLAWTRPYQIGHNNQAVPYAATFERVIEFARGSQLPDEQRLVRPIACPHDDCPDRRDGGRGWCTVILRVPELAAWGVLCPACMRVPDVAQRHLRLPLSYLLAWQGPLGFRARVDGQEISGGTFLGDVATYALVPA